MDATMWLWLAIAAGVLAVLYGVFSMTLDLCACRRATRACRRSPRPSRPAPRPISTASTRPSPSSASCCSSSSASAARLADRGRLRGRRDPLGPDRLHRHEHLGARQRAHRASRHTGSTPRSASRSAAARSPACWSSASACSASPATISLLRQFLGVGAEGALHALVGLAFGGSLISIFARLGGGIFTKGADVGADLVGKVEAGIPEDDPRNPAVIADNVGDNVGDCAGMAADLFETYAVTLIATMLLGGLLFAKHGRSGAQRGDLSAGARRRLDRRLDHRHVLRQGARRRQDHERALQGRDRLGRVSAVAFCSSPQQLMPGAGHAHLSGCALIGLALTAAMIVITEYYTATEYSPVRTSPQPRRPATPPTSSPASACR